MGEETQAARVWENRFQTILLSIITAAVLGLFGFLWTMNRDFGKMEERDLQRTISQKDQADEMKALRSDFNTMNERVIKIEQDKLYREAERQLNRKY